MVHRSKSASKPSRSVQRGAGDQTSALPSTSAVNGVHPASPPAVRAEHPSGGHDDRRGTPRRVPRRLGARPSPTFPTPECATCGQREKICQSQQGQGPPFCPTVLHGHALARAAVEYAKPEIRHFALQASLQEAECYHQRGARPFVCRPMKPRVQETCEFAKRMGYSRIGLAFCSGLRAEARTLANILRAQGFEVVSVVCKTGGTPKETLGVQDDQKIHVGEFESMCSPVVQAMVLNDERTDFNIIVGLCVGHDSLFMKYSDAFCTVLIAKDRVLGHNPVAALYTLGSYYSRLLEHGF